MENNPEKNSSSQTSHLDVNVLLVDDAQLNRLLGKKMFEKCSANVYVAKDGIEAIETLKNSDIRFDIILMDLEMPRLGGLQAATEIREQQLSFAPIYALTAHDSEETRFLCRAAKMNGFIIKPLQFEEVQKILARLN